MSRPLYNVQEDAFSAPPPPSAPRMEYEAPSAPELAGAEKVGLLRNESCRFCEEAVDEMDFIRPCLCERRCHRRCLDRARALDEAFMGKCGVCNFVYETELVPDEETCTPMCKFRALVLRDFVLLMALVQGLICLLGFLILPAIDGGHWRYQWFPVGWSLASINYVCGLVVFFAILGVVGLMTLLVRACSAACSCCCQCCYDEDDEAFYRDSHSYYTGNTFCICFYPIPAPYYHHHHHHYVHHHHGSCACLGCGSCNCSGGSSGSGGGGNNGGAILLIVILVLAAIGVIFALIISVLLLTRLYHRHAKIAQRYHEARQRRVRDIGNGKPSGSTSVPLFQQGSSDLL